MAVLSATELLARVRRCAEGVERILRQSPDAEKRAAGIAEMLSALWPGATLYACRLQDEADDYPHVVDVSAQSRPDWAEKLCAILSSTLADERADADDPIPLPGGLNLPEELAVIETSPANLDFRLTLAFTLPKTASADTFAAARLLLMHCVQDLQWRLGMEKGGREPSAARDDLAALTWLADVGELASPVAHEFNNVLNNILLHLAIVEQKLPQEARSDLNLMRQQVGNATSMMKLWHQYRHEHQPPAAPVDVNHVVSTVARDWMAALPAGPHPPLQLTLANGPLAIEASAPDVKRLLNFLVINAARAAPSNQPIAVETSAASGRIAVRVHDQGPPIPADRLTHVFEPAAPPRQGFNGLEMGACRTLVGRLGGKIRVENAATGGVVVSVEFPEARDPNEQGP